MSFRSSVPGFGKKLIIEARVNEYMARDVNPNVPFTPDELAEAAAACREAGASLLHSDARNADGSANHASEAYLKNITKTSPYTDTLITPTPPPVNPQTH